MSKTHAAHNIFIHFPKDPDCEICRPDKLQKARCQSSGTKACDASPVPQAFGDAGMLDHKVVNEDDKGRDGDRNACTLDRTTYWLQAYGDTRKTAEATIRAMQALYGPRILTTANRLKTPTNASTFLMIPQRRTCPKQMA